MADAQASGACGSTIVWVQVPSPALTGESVNGFLFYFVQIILKAARQAFMEFLLQRGRAD